MRDATDLLPQKPTGLTIRKKDLQHQCDTSPLAPRAELPRQIVKLPLMSLLALKGFSVTVKPWFKYAISESGHSPLQLLWFQGPF
jgi:hypothetical protein